MIFKKKKWKNLLLSLMLLPVFGILAVPSDDEQTEDEDTEEEREEDQQNQTSPIKTASGKTYTKKEIEELEKRNHDLEIEAQKQKNKGKTKEQILEDENRQKDENLAKTNAKLQLSWLEIEATKTGLDMTWANDIVIESNDTRETIKEKVEARKKEVDTRIEAVMKEKGLGGTVLKPTDKSKKTSIFNNKKSKRKPFFNLGGK